MRSSGGPGFEEWAASRQQQLLRIAFLLTGDLRAAEALVQRALAQVSAQWRRRQDGDPTTLARTVLTRDFWRQGRAPDDPGEPLEQPSPRPTAEEADRMLGRALGRLSARQRCIVVLHGLEGLADAEIARVVGGRVRSVERERAEAWDRLRAAGAWLLEPGTGQDTWLVELMTAVTDDLPAPDLLTGAEELAGPLRRRRRTVVVAAVAASVVVVAGLVAVGLARDKPDHEDATYFRLPRLSTAPVRNGLDVRKLDELPAASSKVPSDLTPRSPVSSLPGRAVLVGQRDRGRERGTFLALAPDGRWHRVRVSTASGGGRVGALAISPGSLSPDGTRVVLHDSGRGFLYVVDLGTGRAEQLLPADQADWYSDSRHLLLIDPRADTATRYDAVSGHTDEVPLADARRSVGQVSLSGSALVHLSVHANGTASPDVWPGTLVEEEDGRIVAQGSTAGAYGLLDVLAGPEQRLAMTVAHGARSPRGTRLSRVGLAAYTDHGRTLDAVLWLEGAPTARQVRQLEGPSVMPRTWLGPDRLLFSLPRSGKETRAATVFLVWDTRTGAVSTVGETGPVLLVTSWASDEAAAG